MDPIRIGMVMGAVVIGVGAVLWLYRWDSQSTAARAAPWRTLWMLLTMALALALLSASSEPGALDAGFALIVAGTVSAVILNRIRQTSGRSTD